MKSRRLLAVGLVVGAIIVVLMISKKNSSSTSRSSSTGSETSVDIPVTGGAVPESGSSGPSSGPSTGTATDTSTGTHAAKGVGSNSNQPNVETSTGPVVGGNTVQPSAAGVVPGSAAPEIKVEGGKDTTTNKVFSVPDTLKSAKQEAEDRKKNPEKYQSGSSTTGTSVAESTSKTTASGNNGSGAPTNGATPVQAPAVSADKALDNKPKASVPQMSCEEQWKAHVGIFKSHSEMIYMTNMAVQRPLASDITTTHIETVHHSSSSKVEREVMFTSDHPTGTLVLTTISPPPSVAISRDTFLQSCTAAGGRAVGSVLFKMARLKLMDVVDDQVKVGAGTFPVYRMKLEAGLVIGGKTVTSNVDVWMAKNKPGLIVKQNIKIPASAFADHGSITMSTQLAGTKNL